MNDSKLVELVLESPLEDLTLEEIQELRARLAESSVIRAALIDRLQMDQHLVEAFGASGDTPDEFVGKVLRRKQKQQSGSWAVLGATMGLFFFAVIAALVIYRLDLLPTMPIAASSEDEFPPVPSPTEFNDGRPERKPTNNAAGNPTGAVAESSLSIAAAAIPTAGIPVPANAVSNDSEALSPAEDDLKLPTIKPIALLSFARLLSLPEAGRYDSLTKSELESWLERASDKLPGSLQEINDGNRPQIRLKGWFRLRGTLPEQAALRVQFSDSDQMRFHFYHGDEGLSVIRHRHDYSPWYAYAMKRGNDEIQPKDLRLQANDHYRDHRSEARHYQTLCLYFDERTQEIVIHRGDAEVIRAQLAGRPTEILIEGESVIRQLELLPLNELPNRPTDFPIQVVHERPADLAWAENLAEGASLHRNADGSLDLKATNTEAPSWICLPIPGHGIRMVEVELEGFDKAHSLFLAKSPTPNKAGETPAIPAPQDGIVFSKNRKTGAYSARFSHCFDTNTEVDKNPLEAPSVEVRDRAWFRLLTGGGQIRGWVSVDGMNWALLASEDRDTKNLYDHVGISAAKLEGDHTIKIRRMRVRELPRLTGLFSREHWQMVQQIPWDQLSQSPIPDEPYTLADGRKIDADLATQLRRFTGIGTSFENLVLLTEKVLGEFESPSEKKEAIQELLTLTPTWPLENHEKRFLEWCKETLEKLYRQQLSTSDRQDYAEFRREIFHLPTINRDPARHLSRELFNAEVLAAIEQDRWDDVLDSCETIRRYYAHDPGRLTRDFPVLKWAGGIAVRHVTRSNIHQDYLSEGRSASMLVEDLSKEAYNISAELTAALKGGAIADACRLITQIPESATEGLAPSGSDPDHLYSVPAAIQMAVQNHEGLKEQMRNEYSKLAQIRVNAAIQRGDRRVVELVTLQYFDTRAAAEAHLWLGDQATAAGDFAMALQHYLKAARSAEAPLSNEIRTRLLMLGHLPENSTESTASEELSIGSTSLSAGAVLEATQNMLGTRPLSKKQAAVDVPLDEAWPKAGKIKASDLRLDWKWGNDSKSVPGPMRKSTPDWRGKYLASTVVAGVAYASNRFEVARIDLKEPKLAWKQGPRNKEPGKAHHYPLTRCKPLVVEDQVVVRMLHEKSFALYGLDRENGTIIWDANLDGKLILATDPVVVQGRVLIVTLREVSQSTYIVRLSRIDLKSGEIIESQPLFRIRDTWFDRGIGNLVLHREQLLIDLGGVLASCDISGHLQWVRKQLTFPRDIDERWGEQQLSNLVLSTDRGLAFHAGALRLESFDVATGKLLWTSSAANVQSIRRLDDSTFLEEHPAHWKRRTLTTGETLQSIDKPEHLVHWHLTGGELIAVVEKESQEKEQQEPSLGVMQLFPTEQLSQRFPTLAAPPDKTPAVGPAFFGDDRWFLWFSEQPDSDTRGLWIVE